MQRTGSEFAIDLAPFGVADGSGCARYRATGDARVEQRHALERALRGACERGEFSVQYQPIHALATSRLAGAEALLRWRHPQLGVVDPADFIAVAEQCGLIEQLGQCALQQACAAAARWPAVAGPLFVAVNLSACQLRGDAFPAIVRAALECSGLVPGRLHVELTETAVLSDEAHAAALLAPLRALGVRIWLDDFGTGYSRLSHLRRMPVDGLKLDRSFVAGLHVDADDLAMASAIIALAHTLGIAVVAEGIEHRAQLELLRARGCDHAQGFLLGRPMTRERFAAYIDAAVANPDPI